MAIVRCERKHFYDNEKFRTCPHCAAKAVAAEALESQQASNYAIEYIRKNSVVAQSEAEIETPQIVLHEMKDACAGSSPKVPLCTAGWLVCIKGADFGASFSLYAGYNRIGSGSSNEVTLQDTEVARDEHCFVVYEEKKNVFYLVPQTDRPVSLNGKVTDHVQEIQNGQTISLGRTQLELAAFCMGKKKWPER